MMAVGQSVPPGFADAVVVDATGTSHALRELWRARDAILVFVRHFACAGCALHVAALRPRLFELAAIEVDVAIVGNGNPDQLAAFVAREALEREPVRCFTDASRAAYRAAGFQRSAWGTFGPIAIGQLVRARLDGHRNGRSQGDLQQQGGTLYVTRGGVVALYHAAARLGDHAPLVEVIDVALARRAEDA